MCETFENCTALENLKNLSFNEKNTFMTRKKSRVSIHLMVYYNNKPYKREVKKTITAERIKYLGINLIKKARLVC